MQLRLGTEPRLLLLEVGPQLHEQSVPFALHRYESAVARSQQLLLTHRWLVAADALAAYAEKGHFWCPAPQGRL